MKTIIQPKNSGAFYTDHIHNLVSNYWIYMKANLHLWINMLSRKLELTATAISHSSLLVYSTINLMICRTNEDFIFLKESLYADNDQRVRVKTKYTTVRKIKVIYSGVLALRRVIGENKF